MLWPLESAIRIKWRVKIGGAGDVGFQK